MNERHNRIRNHLMALLDAGYIKLFWSESDAKNKKTYWYVDPYKKMSTKEVECFIKGANLAIWG